MPLTAQQPINNVVRVAIQALAGVLGGTQSLHTNCMDETLSLPTEQSVTLALRTQQIIAEESGVVNNIDPLGGSYFIEELTNKIEQEAFDYIKKIDDMGGIISCIENGYPQNEIADSAYVYQNQLDKGQKTIVGVNKYNTEYEEYIAVHKFDEQVENRQIIRLKEVKSSRNIKKAKNSLAKVRDAALNGNNLMPFIIDAVREYVTLGEISNVFRDIYGEYKDPGYC